MALISAQQLKHVANMHLGYDEGEVAKDSHDMVSFDRNLRGNCVADLRLDLH